MTLLLGDCIEVMRTLEAGSVSAVVCDGPYGLGFMGKKWDQPGSFFERQAETGNRLDHVGGNHNPADSADSARTRRVEGQRFQEWCEAWAAEALRLLKPGGHLVAFGGTRTYHRLACGIEDAGFEIRDSLAWLYGSGFPKSLDVSKAIDKAAGAEREVVGRYQPPNSKEWNLAADKSLPGDGRTMGAYGLRSESMNLTAPATEEAERWQGWGTALKPAHEQIVVARKPLTGTVAANVVEHGTGALNIDGCRVGFAGAADERESKDKNRHGDFGSGARENRVYGEDLRSRAESGNYDAPGRWPANIVLSHDDGCVLAGTREVASDGHYPSSRPSGVEIGTVGHAGQDGLEERHTRGETVEVWECVPDCPVRLLDEQTGEIGGGLGTRGGGGAGVWNPTDRAQSSGQTIRGDGREVGYGDKGGASRFFYTAKASRAERNAGLVLCSCESSSRPSDGRELWCSDCGGLRGGHPTVKPVSLMRWLVRLVTPPGGLVLDPFIGSGTTGIAATLEGFPFIGIDQDADYLAIAAARIAWWKANDPGSQLDLLAEPLS